MGLLIPVSHVFGVAPPRAPRARPRARAPPDACSPPARPRFFETFSYLPPLTDAEILKQVQYLLKINASPCVEFAFPADSYAGAGYSTGMDSRSSSGYYTNRYWAMWKLPMYGATDADQVLQECKKCAKAFPNAFVRLCGFDAIRQARRPPPPAQALYSPLTRSADSLPTARLRAHRCRWSPSLCSARPPARLCP